MQKAEDYARNTYGDEFLRKIMEEARHLTEKQVQIYKRSNGSMRIVDKSGGDLIAYLAGSNEATKVAEAEQLLRQLQLNESLYYSHVVRG